MRNALSLPRLPTLKIRALPKLGAKLPTAPRTKGKQEPPELAQIGTPPPRTSKWDVWTHAQFRKHDALWTWDIWIAGTIPDAYHPLLKIAVYLDGPVHEFRNLFGKDEAKRARLRLMGIRVVVWKVSNFIDLRDHFEEWYRRDIGF